MDYSGFVRSGKRARSMNCHVQRVFEIHLLSGHAIPERFAFDELCCYEVAIAFWAGPMNAKNVRMSECERCASFLLEAAQLFPIFRKFRCQNFQRPFAT